MKIFGQNPFYRTKVRKSVFRENELGYNGSDKHNSNVISSQNACMNWLFVTECLKTNIILCINISPYFTENIARCSSSTINKMHLLYQIIYSCKTLQIFRTVFPSIIRSSKLRIQQRYMSSSCCYRLLSGISR